ncbi:aminotransferase (plasmid) [Vitreoscilla filiformis]|uniref:Putative 8-amino-7-oxononanoate synthase n=2 Tax=Vitreoscilla filiformis TaxID=63 RepID=A0A221KJ85_VITFI|nr:aminotransferase [Vitreoscilla filiformis]
MNKVGEDRGMSVPSSLSTLSVSAAPAVAWPEHGGPDAAGPVRFDFSTNANPLPAPEELWQVLRQVNRCCYPEPSYRALRACLGAWSGVGAERIVPTAGSSEAIRRLSLAAHLQGWREVWVPEPGYADYRVAAQMLGLRVHAWRTPEQLMAGLRSHPGPALVWITEPASPTGGTLPPELWPLLLARAHAGGAHVVLDRAYEPLRLYGHDPVPPDVAQQCWQMLSPNKALGLTGIRAGWLVVPEHLPMLMGEQVRALAPSWVLSAEGVGLLQTWCEPSLQQWLSECRTTLRQWRQAQRDQLAQLGWMQEDEDSVTPFWLARPMEAVLDWTERQAQLRQASIKLRDARSFGLPGWVRISTQSPTTVAALRDAWRAAARPSA